MSFLPSLSPGNVKGRLPTDWKFVDDLSWTRPTQWIDLGKSTYDGTTPEKIIGLVAVIPNDSHNYVAFNLDTTDGSNITVNWGDGTTESLTQNVTHSHMYDYDSITTDTSTAKATLYKGYKQVKFEVSLTGSAKFSNINFDVSGPFTTFASRLYRRGSNILDLFVSSSNATDIEISDNYGLTICEQIEYRNTSSNRVNNPNRLYAAASNLESIPFVPWVTTNTKSYQYVFYRCHRLKFLPDGFADPDKGWFNSPSNMQEAFRYCFNLQYLPPGLFGTNTWSSCTSFYLTFSDCRNLRHIPYLPMRTGAGVDTRCDYIFHNCTSLKALPQGLSLERAKGDGIDRIFYNLQKVTDWSALYDNGVAVLDNFNHTAIDMTDAFYNWEQLEVFPYIGQFTKCTNAQRMFGSWAAIKEFDSQYTHLDLTNCTNMRQTFEGCNNIREIPEIKVRSLTNNNSLYYTFNSCHQLEKVKFTGMIAGPGDGEYNRMFNNARSLTVIDGIDFSFATETSDYYQTFHVSRDICAIKFPGTFRAGYASPRINVTVANHSDISGEYHITAAGTGYEQSGGNGELTVAESGGNYTWTLKDSSDDTPTETSTAASNTQYTPWAADWSGATNAVTFSEVKTGFKYTISGGSGDGLRYSPIQRTEMLEIFNQLADVSYSATIDIRNNSYTADLTSDDIAIATNKGWTVINNEGTFT